MARRIWIILGYVVAALLVVAGTVLLVAYGDGYTYNFKTGRLSHRGLIIINSVPGTGQIFLNGKLLHHNTPYQQEFAAGWYNFTLEKSGYRTWSKRVQAIPSQATQIDYVILLPQHIAVEPIGAHVAISQFMASPDHHHIAFVVPSGNHAGVWTVDTDSHQQTRVYAAAPATPTTPAEGLTLLSWSQDNTHVLIKSQIGSTTSLQVVDTSGGSKPVNVTTTLGISADNLIFNPNDWQQLYWQSPDGLRRLDLGSQTISAPLATNVKALTFDGGKIIYVDASNPKQPPSLWEMNGDGSNKQRLVTNLTPSSAYQVAFAYYLGTPEAVVVAQDSHSATLYSNVYGQVATHPLTAPATTAIFNDSGRLVALTDASHLATYDLQLNTTYTFPPINSTVTGLSWFDGHHLVFNRNGDIVLSEFDDNYAVVITRANSLPPISSANNKTVLAASQTSTGTTLVKAVVIQQ